MSNDLDKKFKTYRKLADKGQLDMVVLGDLMVLGCESDMAAIAAMHDKHQRMCELAKACVRVLDKPFSVERTEREELKFELEKLLT